MLISKKRVALALDGDGFTFRIHENIIEVKDNWFYAVCKKESDPLFGIPVNLYKVIWNFAGGDPSYG